MEIDPTHPVPVIKESDFSTVEIHEESAKPAVQSTKEVITTFFVEFQKISGTGNINPIARTPQPDKCVPVQVVLALKD